jgi:transcriptional antiterminator RfaH
MFPGYLFARFELALMHRHVRYAHGVSGIVKFADRYPTIEEEAIAQLRGHTDAAEVKEMVYELSEGDPVQIVGGAFVGLDAVVTQVLEAKERVKVLMDFLGRKMEAEVQCSSVIRQVSHPLAA